MNTIRRRVRSGGLIAFGVALAVATAGETATARKETLPMKLASNAFREGQAIHSVRLEIFPGDEAALTFVACLWTSYVTHEQFELVRVDGARILDPHVAPFDADSLFRRAAPSVLTRETLERTLSLFLPAARVAELLS